MQVKHRRERGQLLAEGPQAVREALGEGVVAHVFVEPDAADRRGPELQEARDRGVAVHLVEGSALATLTTAQTPQGIVAVCHWEPVALDDLLADLDLNDGAAQLVLAHEMSDPGNAGALIRVADAAGARGVLLSAASVDPSNAKCVRASAGSLFHLPVAAAGETLAALSHLRRAGWRTLAADVTDESLDLFAAEREGLLAGRVVWVFGNEAHGLPDAVLAEVDGVVRIPILGRAESLNLATAAAICLYAYARVATTP
jgi:TrmH family RNA methyltransferase